MLDFWIVSSFASRLLTLLVSLIVQLKPLADQERVRETSSRLALVE